jgi:hypothetical protein
MARDRPLAVLPSHPRDHVDRMIFTDWERILTAPYEEREGWQLNVMCVNGTLYLEEHLSDARLIEK